MWKAIATEVERHPACGRNADRRPEEAEHQARRTGEQNDRQVIELVLRHADPEVTLNEPLLVESLVTAEYIRSAARRPDVIAVAANHRPAI